jgi:ABC-2 type transport system ATP-binding protein
MVAPMIQTHLLRKHYGNFVAVAGLDLEVEAGEIFALLGPNGAGKTTTIRMLMGIVRPSGGAARIAGLDCFGDRIEVKRRVGFLPDEPIFYDYLRGREIIQFVGEMHGLSPSEIDDRVAPLVERLELADALEEFAVNYSRGMKKKLALTCALLHDPLLVILDEPTSGLDPSGIRTLHILLRELAAAGKTVFYSTHMLDHAEKLCNRVGIVHKGKLAMAGTVADLCEERGSGSLEEVFFRVTRQAPCVTAEEVRSSH